MVRVNPFYKKSGTKLVFHFSEEQDEELRTALSRYEKRNINDFINDLEFVCTSFRDLKAKDIKGRKSDKPMLKHLIGKLKQAHEELETHILREGWPFLKSYEVKGELFDVNLIVDAQMVNAELEKLINHLQRRKETYKSGRPKKVRFEFVRQIGLSFLRHLGEPKFYSGPFPHTVSIAFRAIGFTRSQEGGDHSRIIKQVLREYPFTNPSHYKIARDNRDLA